MLSWSQKKMAVNWVELALELQQHKRAKKSSRWKIFKTHLYRSVCHVGTIGS